MPVSARSRARFRLTPALMLALALCGCASWPAHGVRPTPEGTYRIALLPVAVTAHVNRLADLTTVPPPGPEGEAGREADGQAIAATLAGVGADMTRTLAEDLAASPVLDPVPPERVAAAAAASGEDADPATVARAAGADAALVVDVSGYGRIKRRWLVYLIGSGAVEAVAQGVIAYHVVDNGWVALGVGLEELGSELLTWGGGTWLFNARYAPVTLEAKLVAAADGRTVWRDVVFVPVDRKALKALPEAERKRREVELRVTAAQARAELVGDLEKAAGYRLHPWRPKPPGLRRRHLRVRRPVPRPRPAPAAPRRARAPWSSGTRSGLRGRR